MKSLGPADPQSIGPYKLRARLGEGGMGRVYLAASPSGQQVAIKVVRPELAAETEFRDRFRREVKTARLVSGAYTAAVVDADPEGASAWLATVYMPGPSLGEAVAAYGPLPEPVLFRLGAGILEAIIAIHRAGVVHRDLKPSNVLLATDGVRVIDFGVARAARDTTLTHTGSLLGTASFMSPEQALGDEVGPAGDIFSFGAVLAFAATGHGPFGSGDPAALLFRVVHGEPDLSGMTASLCDLTRRCLHKSPAARPSSDELLALFASRVALDAPQAWPDEIVQMIVKCQAESIPPAPAADRSANPDADPRTGPIGQGAPSRTRRVRSLGRPGLIAGGGVLAVAAVAAIAVAAALGGTALSTGNPDPPSATSSIVSSADPPVGALPPSTPITAPTTSASVMLSSSGGNPPATDRQVTGPDTPEQPSVTDPQPADPSSGPSASASNGNFPTAGYDITQSDPNDPRVNGSLTWYKQSVGLSGILKAGESCGIVTYTGYDSLDQQIDRYETNLMCGTTSISKTLRAADWPGPITNVLVELKVANRTVGRAVCTRSTNSCTGA